jgi:hypothetical protein
MNPWMVGGTRYPDPFPIGSADAETGKRSQLFRETKSEYYSSAFGFYVVHQRRRHERSSAPPDPNLSDAEDFNAKAQSRKGKLLRSVVKFAQPIRRSAPVPGRSNIRPPERLRKLELPVFTKLQWPRTATLRTLKHVLGFESRALASDAWIKPHCP